MWKSIQDKFYRYPILAIPMMMVLFLLVLLAIDTLSALSNPWQPIPPPPSRPEKLLGTGAEFGKIIEVMRDDGQIYLEGDIYIQAEDGQVYTFLMGWDKNEWQLSQANHISRKQCDISLSLLLRKEGQCFQVEERQEIVLYHLFLLDQDNNLWHLSDPSTLSPPLWSFCALSGLVAGMLAAFVLAINSRRRARVSDEP